MTIDPSRPGPRLSTWPEQAAPQVAGTGPELTQTVNPWAARRATLTWVAPARRRRGGAGSGGSSAADPIATLAG